MESDILYQLSVLVLWTSLNENNSNEVAITCALDSDKPLEDVKFFLHFESIRMIVVVTNLGNIHYLCKDDEYIYENARIY